MKHLSKYLLFFLAVSMILFSSCRKQTEKKLVGKWKRVIIEDVGSNFLEYWEFNEDKTLFIHKDAEINNGWTPEANEPCKYMVNSRLKHDYIYVYVDSLKVKSYDGVWEIIHLKKNTMMLVKRPEYQSFYDQGHRERNSDRQGTILFREFVRMD